MERPAGRIRAAELMSALSPATDLGLGRPLEHELGVCLAALGPADRLGCGAGERSEVYYVALLAHVGCTDGAPHFARWAGGDEIRRGGAGSRRRPQLRRGRAPARRGGARRRRGGRRPVHRRGAGGTRVGRAAGGAAADPHAERPGHPAEPAGEWWLDADAAALAGLDHTVILVAAAGSRPELREPTAALAWVLPTARTVQVEGATSSIRRHPRCSPSSTRCSISS